MAGFAYHQSLGGRTGAPPMREHMSAASTEIKPGDPIAHDSDGYVDLASSGDSVLGVAQNHVNPGSGEHPYVHYIPALKDIIWIAENDATPQQTDIGTQIDYGTATTGAFTVDDTTTSNGDVNVLELYDTENNLILVNFNLTVW